MKLISVAVTIAAIGLLGTGTAGADHVHSKEVGNGSCVLLAQNGGEKHVTLPHATDDQKATNRAHPLHLNVHLGQPGQNFEIGVYGTASDPCNVPGGTYLNG